MSAEYQGKSNIDIANEAERDLNSYASKVGNPNNRVTSDSGMSTSSLLLYEITPSGSRICCGYPTSGTHNIAHKNSISYTAHS
jgi:hypothetical protein